MELVPPHLHLAKLRRKMDISNLTLHVAGENAFDMGRFVMLWKVNGNYLVIQAEPWWRPGIETDVTKVSPYYYLEEERALWHVQELIQTMLDTLVFDGENNWAYLVRLKNGSYRLVYKKRRLVHNCLIWTKVVELDDIELTRIVSGLFWEGIYDGKDVDVYIAWQDTWGKYVSLESSGQKLVESRGLSHYFFKLEAHVSKNGVIVGVMLEALVGRPITHADRSAVLEAFGDIQRHGIMIYFHMCDIYITERGVRFASASSAKYYQDCDKLAEDAKIMWKYLADVFDGLDNNLMRGMLSGSRSLGSRTFILPRLPSPGRPIALTREEAIIRWHWSIKTSDDFGRLQTAAFHKLRTLLGSPEDPPIRRGKRRKDDQRALLSPEDSSGDRATSAARIEPVDRPLIVRRAPFPRRHHPYVRPGSEQLLLAPESDLQVVG